MKFFGYELVKSNRKQEGISLRSMLGALYSRLVDTSQIEWPTLSKVNNINKIDYQRTLELVATSLMSTEILQATTSNL